VILLATDLWQAAGTVSSMLFSLLTVVLMLTYKKTERRDVRLLDEFATIPELKRVEGLVKEVDGKVEQLSRHIVENGDRRRAAIEGKVEDVRLELKQDIQESRTGTEAQLASMREATQKQFNVLIERVGELTGKTGTLKGHAQ